jgi:uncharacterized membrane protein
LASVTGIALVLILIFAAGIRVYHLGHASLWYDEVLTIEIASQPLGDIPGEVRAREAIGPLYHLFMHFWTDALGDRETAARLPPAFCGVATVVAAFALGRALFGVREGLAAATLAAVSGFQVYYSQEARPYTLLLFLSLVSCLAFVRLIRRASWQDRLFYVAITAALLWTHLYSIFVIAAQHLAWLTWRWEGRRKLPDDPGPAQTRDGVIDAREWIVLNVAVALLFAPWIPTVIGWFQKVAGGFWIPPIGPGALVTTYATYAGSSFMLIALTLLALWGIVRTPGRWKILLLAGGVLLPVVVPIAVSLVKRPLFVPRYGIAAGGFLYLLAARGWAVLPNWAARMTVAIPILALAAVDLYGAKDRLDPKPDWRGATRYVLDHDRRGDAILLNADFNNLVFMHYASRWSKDVDAAQIVDLHGADAVLPGSLRSATSLWMLTQPAVYGNYAVRSAADLEKEGWRRVERRPFDTIIVEHFVR